MSIKLNSCNAYNIKNNLNFGMKINNTEGLSSLITEWDDMGYTSPDIITALEKIQTCADDTYDIDIYSTKKEYCAKINDGSKRGLRTYFKMFSTPEEVLAAIQAQTAKLNSNAAIEAYSDDYQRNINRKAAEEAYDCCVNNYIE